MMAGTTTVVFGEALVDDFGTEQMVGGAPFNVARHLAALMSPQLMVTRVGDDHNGSVVRAECERFAMAQTGVQTDPLEETGRVIVERGPSGQHRFSILPGQAYDYIDRAAALAAVAPLRVDVLYFGTLAQRGARSRAALEALWAALPDACKFLDLNLRGAQVDERCVFHSLQAADIVKVNEEELQALFGWYFQIKPTDPALSAEEVRAACRALVQKFSLEALIVTLGHRGSVYFGHGQDAPVVHRDNPVPPFVIDTVGAGDAFAAIFLLGRARGWGIETSLARANAFAGAICALPGAIPRDLGFYEGWMNRWR